MLAATGTTAKALLLLVAKGIGNDAPAPGKEGLDYSLLIDMAQKHSVSTLAVDGLQAFNGLISLSDITDQELMQKWLAWYGQSVADEAKYEKHHILLSRLTRLFECHGIKTLLLKGMGLSYLYPKPSHRQCGDIDVVFLQEREDGILTTTDSRRMHVGERADEIIKGKGVKVRQDGDKHSTFSLENVSIENHASFVDSNIHPCLKPLEEFFGKELKYTGQKKLLTPKGTETTVYLPSPNTNALFLSMHLATHFFHGEANLRQLCDWAVFVRESKGLIDWNKVQELSKQSGHYRFLCAINGIVTDYLFTPSECLPEWAREKDLEEKILDCILTNEPSPHLNIINKVKRYFGNKWKYDLVFNDNMYASSLRLARAYIREQWMTNAKSLWKVYHRK